MSKILYLKKLILIHWEDSNHVFSNILLLRMKVMSLFIILSLVFTCLNLRIFDSSKKRYIPRMISNK